jgi:hypothetical protein
MNLNFNPQQLNYAEIEPTDRLITTADGLTVFRPKSLTVIWEPGDLESYEPHPYTPEDIQEHCWVDLSLQLELVSGDPDGYGYDDELQRYVKGEIDRLGLPHAEPSGYERAVYDSTVEEGLYAVNFDSGCDPEHIAELFDACTRHPEILIEG